MPYTCGVSISDEKETHTCKRQFTTGKALRDHRRDEHYIKEKHVTASQLVRLKQLQRLTNDYTLTGTSAQSNEELTDYEADGLIQKHEYALIEDDRRNVG